MSIPNPRLPPIPQAAADPAGVLAVLNAMRQRIEALTGYATALQTTTVSLVATVGAAAAAGTGTPPPAAAVVSPYSPMTAGATVNAHRVLMFDAGGRVVHADTAISTYAFAGISTQSAVTGATLLVAEQDIVTEAAWSWTPGTPLFVGAEGTLTPTPPATGVVQQVAVAASATSILVQPFPILVRH